MPFEIPQTLEEAQLQEVPESFRGFYSKKEDGKFHFDAVPKKDLHKSMDINRQTKSEAETKLKAYEGIDDPEEARALVADKRKREQEEAAKAGNTEALLKKERERLEAKHAKELAEREERLSAATQREARYVRDQALTNAAIKAGVVESAIEDVLLLGGSQLSVKDGVLVDGDGDKVDAEKWLKGHLAKKKHWLGASTGGGTQKGSGGAPTSNKRRSEMSDNEKVAYISQHGRPAFFKLPE